MRFFSQQDKFTFYEDHDFLLRAIIVVAVCGRLIVFNNPVAQNQRKKTANNLKTVWLPAFYAH
jgi:hypothetical protein